FGGPSGSLWPEAISCTCSAPFEARSAPAPTSTVIDRGRFLAPRITSLPPLHRPAVVNRPVSQRLPLSPAGLRGRQSISALWHGACVGVSTAIRSKGFGEQID